jgi:hypothetical protein
MNFGKWLNTVDAVIALGHATRQLRGGSESAPRPPRPASPPPPDTALNQPAVIHGIAGQIESRLTNVVVAALKEAFDRDHARLELERAQLDEQGRRAEAALRLEMRRQAADREVGRLRLLAGTAMAGWVASLLLLGWRIPLASPLSRLTLAAGWVLLLAALGSAFSAMGRVGAVAADPAVAPSATSLPMWLLILGLGVTAVTLLI